MMNDAVESLLCGLCAIGIVAVVAGIRYGVNSFAIEC